MLRLAILAAALLFPSVLLAADMVSHRAMYEYDPQTSTDGQQPVLLSGMLQIETRRTCAGWVTNATSRRHRSLPSGLEVVFDSRTSRLESLDGTSLRFSSQERVNGRVTETREGSARLNAVGGAGQATFTKPAARQMDLPAGTLFPTAHTLRQIEQAQRNERLFDARVFSGDSVEVERLNSILLSAQRPQQMEGFPALSPLTSWRMSETMFSSDTEPTPVFESSARLWANGVVGDLEIRAGGQTIRRRLVTLEILPDEGC